LLLAVGALLAFAGAANAAGTVTFDGSIGTKKPPKRLGGQKVRHFKRDHRHLGNKVTSVKGPTGRIRLSSAAIHDRVKNSQKSGFWKTWSNGYHGDVYYISSSVTMTLPAHTTAFYFYAEPNDHRTFTITATGDGATSRPVHVNGKGGAKFFGFVASGGAEITSITVSSDDLFNPGLHLGGGFAVGEFGIHKG
jgi:hypothetical protein